MNRCFLYPRMGPSYLYTLYSHQKWVLFMEAAMFLQLPKLATLICDRVSDS